MMTKENIVQALTELVNVQEGLPNKEQYFDLLTQYYDAKKADYNTALEAFKETAGEDDNFEYTDEMEEQVLALKEVYSQKMKAHKEAKKVILNERLAKKEVILKELTTLNENEKTIGEAFGKIKEIQEAWKAVGETYGEKGDELQSGYNFQRDIFFHNININKDLRDLDFNRNLKEKQALIEKAEEIANSNDVRIMEKEIKRLRYDWYEVGPVARELKDEVNQKFKDLLDKIYQTINADYEERKVELQANLGKKIALCERLNEVVAQEYPAHKDWTAGTEKIVELQKEWKTIGYSEENETVWQVFRNSCDTFFNKKRDFYKVLDSAREQNAKKKEVLIEKAVKAQTRDDWRKGTEYFVQLQRDWKAVGAADRANEQKLWKKFRSACDHFFNAKKAFYDTMDERNAGNLTLKNDLIEEIKSFTMTGNTAVDLETLKVFSKKFSEIGHVPLSEKDTVYTAYKSALDEKYDSLKLSIEERKMIRIQNRTDVLSTAQNSAELIKKELYGKKKDLDKLNDEISNYESNIAMFSKGNPNHPFAIEGQKKLKTLLRKKEDLLLEIKVLKSVGKKKEEPVEVTSEQQEETSEE